MLIALIVIGYLVCWFLTYGLTLGEFTKQFPYMRHTLFAFSLGVWGPVSLLVTLFFNHASFRLKPYSTEQRWEIFNTTYGGVLDRAYFDRKHA